MATSERNPWYREPWPWLLIAGPLAVVIASGITFWLAIVNRDPLVVDDYYKAGKAINKTLQRDAYARALGLGAEMEVSGGNVSIMLRNKKNILLPSRLRLLLTHATQIEKDRVVVLNGSARGHYDGALAIIERGRYRLTLEDFERTWRLTADWRAGSGQASVSMGSQ